MLGPHYTAAHTPTHAYCLCSAHEPVMRPGPRVCERSDDHSASARNHPDAFPLVCGQLQQTA